MARARLLLLGGQSGTRCMAGDGTTNRCRLPIGACWGYHFSSALCPLCQSCCASKPRSHYIVSRFFFPSSPCCVLCCSVCHLAVPYVSREGAQAIISLATGQGCLQGQNNDIPIVLLNLQHFKALHICCEVAQEARNQLQSMWDTRFPN